MLNKKGKMLKIVIIILAIVFITIFSLYAIKTVQSKNESLIKDLQEENEQLKIELETKSTNNADNIDVSSKEETVKTEENNFFGIFSSEDDEIKFVFLPNGEMSYNYSNTAGGYKVLPGNYYIENNELHFYTNKLIEWFDGNAYISVFTIVDENTLEYGSEENGNLKRYYRNNNAIEGNYGSSDRVISFENNSFKITSEYAPQITGTYEQSNNIITLKYSSEDVKDDIIYILDGKTLLFCRDNNYDCFIKNS